MGDASSRPTEARAPPFTSRSAGAAFVVPGDRLVRGGAFGWIGLLLAAAFTQAGAQERAALPNIADNSFLLEEAYNQEPGVVQHISAFQLFRGADSWVYTFTQEWPLFSRTHQLSFTVPIQRVQNGASFATGVGDVAVNYRYQLAAAERLSVAPRLSLLLPTGRAKADLGAGALGVQVNLPASVVVARQVVTHWNAGGTLTPSAKNAVGDQASGVACNLGASVVWLARPTFNALLEIVWTR